MCVCSFVKIGLAWKSDRNMGDPVRIELANNGLLTLLSNNFTMSGMCVCVCVCMCVCVYLCVRACVFKHFA